MGKFRKGDKVIVNPTLKIGDIYGNIPLMPDMKIPGVQCITDIYDDVSYIIEESGFYYTEEMLLPVPLFKPGDKVIIRKNLKDIYSFPFGYGNEMNRYEGNTYTIKNASSSGNNSKLIGFDGYLYTLVEDELYYSWPSVAFDLSNYKLKTNNYESRLQKQESPLRRGSREISDGVCCRVNRARVEVSTLGYKKVLGRV